MIKHKGISVIVEGFGDVYSAPSLVAKSAMAFGLQVFLCETAIRAGEARKLMRPGELERYLELAASREEAEAVILLLDLDDMCAATLSKEFSQRADAISGQYNKPIHICFVVREYECWFLHSIGKIAKEMPEYGIAEDSNFASPENIRAAKQTLGAACKLRRYKETRDQSLMTKHLDFVLLTQQDRSFRKFAKALTGIGYEKLEASLK